MKVIIDTIDDYKSIFRDILHNGEVVKIRGENYKEISSVLLITTAREDNFFLGFPQFGMYLSEARLDYILSNIEENLEWITELLQKDKNSRQAMIYKPDWYWERKPEHVNCIVAYQFTIRDDVLFCHVFMRSSDYYNAFPIDWFTTSRILQFLWDKFDNLEGSEIRWYISNLHIREQDIPIIERLLEK